MTQVTAVFWDLGGVLLSNGWDHDTRAEAARRFHLDEKDLQNRHEELADAFETGRMNLDTYLQRAVFYQPRGFTVADFKQFIFEHSTEKPDSRAILEELSTTRCLLLATLNNESVELNLYRIRKFQLTRNFKAFFSSCYMGVRKPNASIYERVLAITQRAPEETIFIDDRPANLEPARCLGIRAVLFQSAAQLRGELASAGVLS